MLTARTAPADIDAFRAFCAGLGITGYDTELPETGFRFSEIGPRDTPYVVAVPTRNGTLDALLPALLSNDRYGVPAVAGDLLAYASEREDAFSGLQRVIAPGSLWTRPGTSIRMTYAPALYQLRGVRYLGLHRMDEIIRPDHGVLMRALSPTASARG